MADENITKAEEKEQIEPTQVELLEAQLKSVRTLLSLQDQTMETMNSRLDEMEFFIQDEDPTIPGPGAAIGGPGDINDIGDVENQTYEVPDTNTLSPSTDPVVKTIEFNPTANVHKSEWGIRNAVSVVDGPGVPVSQLRIPFVEKDANGTGDTEWLAPDADIGGRESGAQQSIQLHAIDIGGGVIRNQLQLNNFDVAATETPDVTDLFPFKDLATGELHYAALSAITGTVAHDDTTGASASTIHDAHMNGLYWIQGDNAAGTCYGENIGNDNQQITIDLDNQQLETNGTPNLAWDATDISITLGGQQMDIKPGEIKTDTNLDIITSNANTGLDVGTTGSPWEAINMDASGGGAVNLWILGNDLTVRSDANGTDDLNLGQSAALDWANINLWIATSLGINGSTGQSVTLPIYNDGTVGNVTEAVFTHGILTGYTLQA